MISAFPPRASPSSQLFAFLSRQHVERLATTNLGQELSPENMAKICSPVQALLEAHVDPLPSFQASGLMSFCEPLRAHGLSLCGTPSPGYRRTHYTSSSTLHCSDMADKMPTNPGNSSLCFCGFCGLWGMVPAHHGSHVGLMSIPAAHDHGQD